MILETERLTVRLLCDDDVPFTLRLLNEPSYIAHIGDRGVRTLDQARDYLHHGPIASYAANGYGLWWVGLKDGGAPIGMAGILRRDTLPHPDVGYAMLPEYWGQGYAYEVNAAVVHHARTVFHLPTLMAVVSPHNARSKRLLDKLGFASQGLIAWGEEQVESFIL